KESATMSTRMFPDAMPRRNASAAVLLLLLVAGEAGAGSIYKCVDARGPLAFQGVPCATGTMQTAVEVRGQPPIDAAKLPSSLPVAPAQEQRTRSRGGHGRRRATSHRSRAARVTSWECRAADGEVFYRHSRCPHTVPGDGVMRSGGVYAIGRAKRSRSRARTAWSPVPVHARRVSRSEACRQINAVAAVERDGSARDERASVYEHDLGRDPCAGY
ncbi:MAG TPA: DUF4124 domain-containing protein, partial [Rhodanobacteraceae bacterium]